MPETAKALTCPNENPSTACGCTPRACRADAMPTDNAQVAGCAYRVSLSFSAGAFSMTSATS